MTIKIINNANDSTTVSNDNNNNYATITKNFDSHKKKNKLKFYAQCSECTTAQMHKKWS